jgi:hypothetical protein
MSDRDFEGKICAIEDENLRSSLESDATVQCGRCGATANDPAALCDPVEYHEQ